MGAGLSNSTIRYTNGAMRVTPAALTITANNKGKTYGNAFSRRGTEFTSAGLVTGDTVTSATLTRAAAPATTTGAGSTYIIVGSRVRIPAAGR